MIIQLIGLPGSGKTYLIKKYLEENREKEITYVDMANEKFNQSWVPAKWNKTKAFLEDIKNASGNVIAESACGVHIGDSEVVRLNIADDLRVEQLENRIKKKLKDYDHDHFFRLKEAAIPASYTVTSEQALFDILDTLFNKR